MFGGFMTNCFEGQWVFINVQAFCNKELNSKLVVGKITKRILVPVDERFES